MMPQRFPEERVKQDMAGAAVLEPDAKLMLRVREGDRTSFELLLERHRSPVIHYLYRMVQDQAVAEELAQDVFLRVYRARATYEPTAKFTTWLFRIATNLAWNWSRDRKHEKTQESLDADYGKAREAADRTPTIEERLLQETRMNEVRRAIRSLPEKQRAAVVMHKYQEMDYAQVARVLQCSESAVKSLLFRAYETLRARLAHMA